MNTLIRDPRCVLIHGTAGALALKPNSIDALVTDPPSGIGFMGREWDSDKGGRDYWVDWLARELAPAYAALKPGGHALVWALPRTSHWTAYALEACGFVLRDRVSALFGSGFPKSLNVSKAIDAMAGAERPVVGKSARHVSGKPEQRTAGLHGSSTFAESVGMGSMLTGPATADAAAWEGWGTALKPAMEDWWLVRKPFDGTVAANVLRYGTGALNIDGCRIMRCADDRHEYGVDGDEGGGSQNTYSFRPQDRGAYTPDKLGRWPAHLILGDEEAAGMLDAQSGTLHARGNKNQSTSGGGTGISCLPGAAHKSKHHERAELQQDGGASRFFYCPKPSTAERERGLEHLPKRSGGEATGREDDTDGLKNPRAGAGRGGGRANVHPTVKSVALMRWLVRLITPPGGIVLDPFAGSGTTGVAALAEGMRFVGVEQGGENGEYLPIIEGRLRAALK